MRSDRVRLVSFSGIDGAGKSTQIEALCRYLQDSGQTFRLYTFWDDVVVLSKFRENMSLRAFKGDKGVGRPDKPIIRRDKNVRSWYLTASRLFLYFLDAVSLRRLIFRNTRETVHFVILDRYIYDELANLPLQSKAIRIYVKLLKKIAPLPDAAFLLDANPEDATSRKPEYPIDFVRANRNAYLILANLVHLTVVPPLPLAEASEAIRKVVVRNRSRSTVPSERGIDVQLVPSEAKKS